MSQVRAGATHVDEDRCLDLVHGLLEPDERGAALQHLKTCPDCETRFREIAASNARGRAAAATLPSTSVAGHIEPRPRTGMRVQPLVALAAVMMLGVGIVWLAGRGPEPLADPPSWLPAPTEGGTIRESDLAPDSTVLAGVRAYAGGDLNAARRLLESARDAGPAESMRLVYLGSTLSRLGDFGGSIGALAGAGLSRIPEPWQSDGYWTLAQAFDRVGRRAAADSVLRILVAIDGPAAARAQAALAKRHSRP